MAVSSAHLAETYAGEVVDGNMERLPAGSRRVLSAVWAFIGQDAIAALKLKNALVAAGELPSTRTMWVTRPQRFASKCKSNRVLQEVVSGSASGSRAIRRPFQTARKQLVCAEVSSPTLLWRTGWHSKESEARPFTSTTPKAARRRGPLLAGYS